MRVATKRSAPAPQELVDQAGRALQVGDLVLADRLAAAATLLEPLSSTGWHLRAIANHHLGRPQEARLSILRALRVRPAYPEAWNTLGNLAGAGGDSDLAAAAYRASIALAPDFADPYNNLGTQPAHRADPLPLFRHALALAPRFVGALLNAAARAPADGGLPIAFYQQALTLEPALDTAWNDLGLALVGIGDSVGAVSCSRRAHWLEPTSAGYLRNLGNAAAANGNDALSLGAWQRAVLLDPGSAPGLMGLGLHQDEPPETAKWLGWSLSVDNQSLEGWLALATAQRHAKKTRQAIAASKAAVCLAPGDERCWWQLSYATDMYDSARDLCLKALRVRIALAPQKATAYIQLAHTYNHIGRQDLAMATVRSAIEIEPQSAPAWDELTTARRQLSLLDEALVSAGATVALAPDVPTALVQYGIVLYVLGHPDAEVWYGRAERVAGPGNCHVEWNRSLLYLAQGDLAGGWERYDYGMPAMARRGGRDYETPRWEGQDLAHKSIMVWREQGVGDELVFANCFDDIIAAAGRCIIECDPRLHALFARSFPTAEIRTDSSNRDGDPEDFDFNLPAGTLPRFFRPTLDSFPTRRGFLKPDPSRVRFWRQRFEAVSGGGPVIGICWRGRLKWLSRMPLYAQLRDWGPILTQPGVTFVNMQYAEPEEEIAEAERLFGCKIHSWPDIDLMNDFDDVAAFGCALDLAITADTAAGALMGALGVPTWRYVTRGDYMSLGTEEFPWMPSIRVFFREVRQQWTEVTARIGVALAAERDSLAAEARDLRAAAPDGEADSTYAPQLGFLINSAIDLQKQGKLDAAAALYRKALSYEPTECLSLQLLGTISLRQNRLDEAEQLLRRAVRIRQDYVPAYVQLGSTWRRAGRLKEAVTALRYALAWDPGHPEAFTNYGECLGSLGDAAGARRHLERVTLLRPALPEMEVNLGNLRSQESNYRHAAAHYRRAAALRPAYVEAHLNLGAAQTQLGEFAAAERSYQRALQLDPGNVVALGNCGDLLRMRGEQEAAYELFQQALAARADSPQAHFVLALVALETGRLATGWAAYRQGLLSGQRGAVREWPIAHWDGTDLAGRRILVWREQGVGDELALASVYPDLIRAAGSVTIECDPRLLSLFARSFPGARVRADSSRNPAPVLDGVDLQVSAGDAASYLRPGIDDFPTGTAGFLQPDTRRAERWKQRLDALGPGAKIGICWRSIRRGERRNLHYATPLQLAPVLSLPGVHFVNLQYGMDPAEQSELAQHGIPLARWPDLDLRNDFENTAALLSQLDAVVGPETAMTALAAAIGRPTFLFLHASWLTLGTDRMPWLPSARLFRRSSPDWEPSLTALAAALDRQLDPADRPIDVGAILQDGITRHRRGDWAGADRAYRRVLERVPDEPDARQLLGALQLQRNDHQGAARQLRAVLQIDPAFPQAFTNLARATDLAGDEIAAMRLYRRAIRLDANLPEANLNLGALLMRQGNADESRRLSQRVLELSPAHGPVWSNLGEARVGVGDMPGGAVALRRSLLVSPGFAQAYVNLGKARLAAGDVAGARAWAEAALTISPDSWQGHHLLAMVASLTGALGHAEVSYGRSLRTGGTATVRWNLALLQLQQGDLAAGWENYEAGLVCGTRRCGLDDSLPLWPGPGTGGRVLVRREQGLGDELLFATCFADLVAAGAAPIIECDPRLASLLQRCIAGAQFVAGDGSAAQSDCQWQIAAGSLPAHFRSEMRRFPDGDPLLRPLAGRVSEWQDRLAALGPRPKIGICWRSSVLSTLRSFHYAAIDELEPIFRLRNVDFICLQHDATTAELQEVQERFGVTLQVWSGFDARDDIEGLAALLSLLNLVIAPDTAVAALAGTLGAPLWKFVPRHSWTLHGTDREPWFPQARMFIRHAGMGWASVFAPMATAIAERFALPAVPALDAALVALADRRYDDAERLLSAAAGDRETSPDALAELSNLARLAGRPAEAIQHIEAALCLAPGHARAMTYLGLLFKDAEDFVSATLCHRRAIICDDDLTDAWINLANGGEQLGDLPTALQALQSALTLDPASAVGWTNLGGVYTALKDPTAARRCCARLDRIDPGSAVAAWNLGLMALSEGQLRAGWAGFHARFDANRQMPVRHTTLPRWQGERLAGRAIVVWSEQGIGDELVFGSCLPELLGMAGRVVVECDARLVGLWQRSMPMAEVRPLGSGGPLPGVEFQAPTGDVAAQLRPDLSRFPRHGGFLAADPVRVTQWRHRVSELGPGPKIGICWRGLRRNANRRAAYTALAQWQEILAVPGIRFVSLQYGDAEEEIAAMEAPAATTLHRWSDLDLRDDFDSVAALMTALDLVIGPDTAATALAGALGRPVWKLTPGNDWMRLGSERYPWLPSVRVFEQRRADWSDVLADIARLLRELS